MPLTGGMLCADIRAMTCQPCFCSVLKLLCKACPPDLGTSVMSAQLPSLGKAVTEDAFSNARRCQ